MKKYILFFVFFLAGCQNTDITTQEESNLTEINQTTTDDIVERIEDPVFSHKYIQEESLEHNQSLNDEKPYMYNDEQLKKLIGNMFIVGFYGTKVDDKSSIIKAIQNYHLGGVILFDKHPSQRGKYKNIQSPQQLQRLTQQLQEYSDYPLFIAIDQEGGKVARLKKSNGFNLDFPSAKQISIYNNVEKIENIYNKMGEMLSQAGVNLNFAPSVDMEINPKNVVIVKLQRSYGKDSKKVATLSKIFIEAMNNHNVLTSIKHFPGHGSSMGDTHQGFVDITTTWKPKELEPYKILIESDFVDTIMIAHVFNKQIDQLYPASLSYQTISEKLRNEMGYDGVVVTDDLQMYAISKHYNLKETIALSMNAGVDLLLFGNQLDPKNIVSVQTLVETTFKLVKSGDISQQKIIDANHRIKELKKRLSTQKFIQSL